MRGDRIMMWRLKDVVNYEKQQKYFKTVGNQLGQVGIGYQTNTRSIINKFE